MKTLFIHMGTHKTGTSALQVFFAQNILKLAECNVIYPDMPGVTEAQQERITSGNGVFLGRFLAAVNGGEDELLILSRILKSASGKNILLSSETFSEFAPQRVDRLLELANVHGYSVKCVFYVRSFAGYALSQYSQLIKRHSLKVDFVDYVHKSYHPPTDIIRKAIRRFGSSSVALYNYDTVCDGLSAHFTGTVLQEKSNQFDHVTNKVNRSLTSFELEFIRQCNVFGEGNSHSTYLSDALIYADSQVSERDAISEELVAFIDEKFIEDLEFINAHGVTPKIETLCSRVLVRERSDFKINPFQKAVISILCKLSAENLP